jgi:FtsP/CotA-like multicopper oxidase with cupredoxin domain
VWLIDDWLLDEQGRIVEAFNTHRDLMHDGRWGNRITVNGKIDEVLRVQAGDRIRLRLLNTATGRVFAPDFGALKPKLIAVDGTYLARPIDLGTYELAPGNRIDLDLAFEGTESARHAVVDRFIDRRPNPLASIEVDGATAPRTFPSPARAKVPVWKDWKLAPITAEFRVNARRGGEHGIQWTFNDRAFGGHDHADPPMLIMREGAFHRLRFVNDSYRLHPIHIHGMFFRLLGRDERPIDEPFFRDTVLMHSKETIDIGVVPLDPGRWMMHCHILEHAEAGMMTTFEVRP